MNEQEVRQMLDDASQITNETNAEEYWVSGRRRRARRRAAVMAGAGGAVAVALGVTAVSTGMWQPPGDEPAAPAAVPGDLTTLLFVPAGSEPELSGQAAPLVPAAEELAGTEWVLSDKLTEDGSPEEITGSDADASLEFPAGGRQGWGISSENCGGAWVQDDLMLDEQGHFRATEVGTDAQRGPENVQRMEDFWMAVLPAGGLIRGLDLDDDGTLDGLLLSVTTPKPPATAEPEPQPSTEPPDEPDDSPAPEPQPQPPEQEPTGEPEQPPEPANEDSLPDFIDPGERISADIVPGGDELFASTVRTGAHDGYDRVVLDITGTGEGRAGWLSSYVTDPVRAGSGEPVTLAGDAVLQVIVSGMAYPGDSEVYAGGDLYLPADQLSTVAEVGRTTPFEGQLTLYLGIDGDPAPYRIFWLEDPKRLVVDVQAGGR